MSPAAELSEPGRHGGMNPGRKHVTVLRNPGVTSFGTCRLDVFRVVIEVCRQLKRSRAAIIVGAAKWAVDTITRGARHVMTLPVSSGKKI